jgi:hypothetical protein
MLLLWCARRSLLVRLKEGVDGCARQQGAAQCFSTDRQRLLDCIQ